MATTDEILAYVQKAKDAGLSPADMIVLIDYSLANQITDGEGKYVVQANDDDVLLRVATPDELIQWRKYYSGIQSGGVIRRTVEMIP